MTVRVASGEASRWVSLASVLVGEDGHLSDARHFPVQHARGYGDKLVLKLAGIDDAGSAETLRGRVVLAPVEEIPELPAGVHFVARLVGMTVVDVRGETLGKVVDVTQTGGADLLVLDGADGEEILVPFARGVIDEVDEPSGVVRVRLPEGLRDLNRPGGGSR